MELSADYSPHNHGTRLTDVVVRPVEPADLLACGGSRPPPGRSAGGVGGTARAVCGEGQVLFVAESSGRIVGYGGSAGTTGRTRRTQRPAGWFLSGCVVDPNRRRQGRKCPDKGPPGVGLRAGGQRLLRRERNQPGIDRPPRQAGFRGGHTRLRLPRGDVRGRPRRPVPGLGPGAGRGRRSSSSREGGWEASGRALTQRQRRPPAREPSGYIAPGAAGTEIPRAGLVPVSRPDASPAGLRRPSTTLGGYPGVDAPSVPSCAAANGGIEVL